MNIDREIEPFPGSEPPDWLDRIGREHWLYFVPILTENRVLTAADLSLLAAASERWSVYRRAAVLMKKSVRGRKFSAAERLRLAEQSAQIKLGNNDAALADFLGMPLQRTRGKLKRGTAPEGNELPAEPVLQLDPKLLGEYVVPPQHSIASTALQDYVGIMKEFGVGPASRQRMKLELEQPPDDDSNSDTITQLRNRRERRAAHLDAASS